jgi:anti-anti-sigma regulatory factor
MTTSEHRLGQLEASVSEPADGPLTMHFRGESDSSDAAVLLRSLFDRYFDAACARGLTLDFSALEYMNSSTFPPIVELIRRLHERGVAISIVYSKDKAWQRTPFKALSSIAVVYKNLTVRAS